MVRFISLSGGEPEFDTPKHIVDAMKRALDEGSTHYGAFEGIAELREAIARKYEGYGVKADPELIIVTPGSTQGIYQALRAVTNPSDEVLNMNPCFFAYLSTFDFLGIRSADIPRYGDEGWRFHPDDIRKTVTPKTRAILFCSPDNPTGAVLGESELREIADVAEEHDLWVISDDIYDTITYDGVRFRSIAAIQGMRERTIVLNGFSKAYAMTGWRLGYIIAPNKDLYDKLMEIQLATYLVVNAAVQRAGVAALTGPQDCVREMVMRYDDKRRYVVDAYSDMDGVTCTTPKGAFYVFPDVSSYGMRSKELCARLEKEAKVGVTSGEMFGSNGEGHFRQSFAQPMNDITEGIERIEKALKKLR